VLVVWVGNGAGVEDPLARPNKRLRRIHLPLLPVRCSHAMHTRRRGPRPPRWNRSALAAGEHVTEPNPA
jgi:hypothetical protein